MMLTIMQVDAFTSRPFAGNPAAVCLLPAPRPEAWMQQVAQEMNLAETAFLVPRDDGYDLRWFTPTTEVDLCGHATLASAHVLWEAGHLEKTAQARFWTRSGLLTARRRGDWIEMDFPATPAEAAAASPDLNEALGGIPIYTGRSAFDYLAEVASEEVVRTLTPDLVRLATLPVRGVIVTSRAAAPGYDFVSRFFAPAVGVPEDPVTGSAHCCLGPYWARKIGRNELSAYQASPRGGVLHLSVDGSRVRLRGQAVTVLRGELIMVE